MKISLLIIPLVLSVHLAVAMDVSVRPNLFKRLRNSWREKEVCKKDEMHSTLMAALRVDDLHTLGNLLKKGIKVNQTDQDGLSLLHHAAAHNSINAIWFLVSKGAMLESRNHQGETPLHEAVLSGSYEAVELFIEFRVDIDTYDNNGWSPLDSAAMTKNFHIAKLLCDHGAVINRDSTRKILAKNI